MTRLGVRVPSRGNRACVAAPRDDLGCGLARRARCARAQPERARTSHSATRRKTRIRAHTRTHIRAHAHTHTHTSFRVRGLSAVHESARGRRRVLGRVRACGCALAVASVRVRACVVGRIVARLDAILHLPPSQLLFRPPSHSLSLCVYACVSLCMRCIPAFVACFGQIGTARPTACPMRMHWVG
eukprot:6194069-Pleurochrysis_carterae.AAC.1